MYLCYNMSKNNLTLPHMRDADLLNTTLNFRSPSTGSAMSDKFGSLRTKVCIIC